MTEHPDLQRRSLLCAAAETVAVLGTAKAANAQPLLDYFDNLGGNGQAGATERKVIANAFGSFDTWETEFRRIGAGLGGCSRNFSFPH